MTIDAPLLEDLQNNEDVQHEEVLRPNVGISCSGGGIRAAAYALGCLQVLGEKNVLTGDDRARFITAVSGGSYAVSSVALVELSREQGGGGKEAMLPYAPGSPELKRLRNELGYLTHGPGGLRSDLWRALMGVVMNLGLFASVIAFFSVIAGWVYGNAFPQLRASCGTTTDQACSTSIHPSTNAWLITGILAATAVLIGLAWVMRRWTPGAARMWQRVSVNMIILAVVVGVLMLAVPQLLAWLHRASIAHRSVTASGVSTGIRHHQVAVGGFIGVAIAIGGMFSSAWKSLSSLESYAVVRTVDNNVLGRGKRIALTVLTALAVPIAATALFLGFALQGAQHSILVGGTSAVQWAYIAIPAAFVLFVYTFGDINSWSLHSIYRSRLSDAFNVERTKAEPGSPTAVDDIDAEQRGEHVGLSRLADLKDFPEVRILATSNIRTYGVTPTGMDAASFRLSGQLIGGPPVGIVATASYETAVKRSLGAFSVMDAVSISGAAVAPEMGKMTRAPLRFLMALANVRLGVWLPKPSVVEEADDEKGTKARLQRRFKPPSLSLLLREAYGSTPQKATDVYVTDGGHYDNLGLVELLKERCQWIWCIDASGDQISTFTTIGQALAIAQAELNVTIDVKPRDDMAPTEGSDFVKAPWCKGTITYPPNGKEPTEGTIVIVKAGVPEDAPWSVGYYQAAHNTFPCDSTLDQLYKAERFDAYLALGRFSMADAFDKMEKEFDVLYSTRRRR
jgi:hypothetical protein